MSDLEKITLNNIKYIREDLIVPCTAHERAFLDEIREKFRWIDDTEFGAGIYLGREKSFTSIHQDDFKTSLKELFDEK